MAAVDTVADFYRLWTLKEASRKARGRGIDAGLQQPAFGLQLGLRCLLAPDGKDWGFASADTVIGGSSYALALAVAGRTMADTVSVWSYDYAVDGARRAPWPAVWQFACLDA